MPVQDVALRPESSVKSCVPKLKVLGLVTASSSSTPSNDSAVPWEAWPATQAGPLISVPAWPLPDIRGGDAVPSVKA